MRYYEFMKEEVNPHVMQDEGMTSRSAERLAKFLRRNCSQWLRETENGTITFYRGLQEVHTSAHAFEKSVRIDRRPKDSSPLGHDVYNMLIDLVGGVANRSNSLFAISDASEAGDYGEPYVIIPIGPYNYTWSRRWNDWNIGSVQELETIISRYMKEPIDIERDAYDAYKKKLSELEWQLENAKSDATKRDIALNIRLLMTHEDKQAFIHDYLEDHDEENQQQFLDPNNYSKSRLENVIMVDRGLKDCARVAHEIMINCGHAMYITTEAYPIVLEKLIA